MGHLIPAGSVHMGIKVNVGGTELKVSFLPQWAELYLKGQRNADFYKFWRNRETGAWEMIRKTMVVFTIKPLDQTRYMISPEPSGTFEMLTNRKTVRRCYQTEGGGTLWAEFPAHIPLMDPVANIALTVVEHFMHP